MLENLPRAIGQALRGTRPGLARLAFFSNALAKAAPAIRVRSPAFEEGGKLPALYTADGEGISPPLEWEAPDGAAALVLLIEDADSPTPRPLVHAIAFDLVGPEGRLEAGALSHPRHPGDGHAMGRNSYLSRRYLAPDPPPGHGPHRYAFELFALGARPDPEQAKGRSGLIAALRAGAVARGLAIATYER